MTDKYKLYLKTKEWGEKRREAKRHAHFLCESCGSKNNLQVHHKTYKNIFHEKPEDLIVLCVTYQEAPQKN
jgi:5-methylcytosine-specific restriction endonuclease McrA